MDCLSVRQTAKERCVSVRLVQILLKNNRAEGAIRFNNHAWMIPASAEKPGDPRRKREASKRSMSSDLIYILGAVPMSAPPHCLDSIPATIREERLRPLTEGAIAYAQGDYEQTIHCFINMAETMR